MYKYLKKMYTVICQKVLGNVEKNHYIINQNHIFAKKYCEVISGWILANFTPKHSELYIF